MARTRLSVVAHEFRHEYAEAIKDDRELIDVKKATAIEWNNAAWLSPFAPGRITPDLQTAEATVRMTQERVPAYNHTLAALQAETGKLKEARSGLLRFLGSGDAINDSAWYLQGRIAEALGFVDTAAEIYSKILPPSRPSPDDAYQLAQIRLGVLRSATH